MAEFGEQFKSRVTIPFVSDIAVHQTKGIVVYSNEKEGICSVFYRTQEGNWQTAVNADMFVQDENWFPKAGEIVWLEDANDSDPVIIGRMPTEEGRLRNRRYPQSSPPSGQSSVRGKLK